MTWSLFRWTWRLDGPLYIGMPPAGSLNRTRVYVPARVMWGALTAELARHEAGDAEPSYENVGQVLKDGYRFSYLYPAAPSGSEWKAWLPVYLAGRGLAWQRQDGDGPVSDRALRRCLLSTRPGTAIHASTDAAEEGSLRETECIQARWRDDEGHDAGPVALVGYVFVRTRKGKGKYPPERRRLDDVATLFLGGDARYGLGRVRREAFDPAKVGEVFRCRANLAADVPQVESARVLAHAHVNAGRSMTGALELVGGWDRGSLQTFNEGSRLWQPGSQADRGTHWTIEAEGTWKVKEPRA